MYNLPYFKEKDLDRIREFIQQHPFAILCGSTAGGEPVATQLPVFLEERKEKWFITGHMMKQTDHHLAFLENARVLLVFTGPHSYVSATWYTNPHQASTWNYMSVHVKGMLRFLTDAALTEVLRKTTLHFEGNNRDSATVFDNLPVDYREQLMNAIVAFEVEVTGVDNVFKLSQNKDEKSFHNIMNHLKQQDENARNVSEEMGKRASELF